MSKSRMGAPRRVATGLLAGALMIVGIAHAPAAGAADDVTSERLAGATRYGTAAAVSADAAFEGATTAILATGENFPDALAASGLAGSTAATPILLTQSDELSDEALAALDDLAVDEVTVVGGTAAVSDDVITSLEENARTESLRSELGDLYPWYNQFKKIETYQGEQARLPFELQIH